jgi:hypothetical protein
MRFRVEMKAERWVGRKMGDGWAPEPEPPEGGTTILRRWWFVL